MKTKIQEVQDYFKAKILSNDFEIVSLSEYIVELLVDSEYYFYIWAGNLNYPESTKPYNGKQGFIDLPFTDEEAEVLHVILIPSMSKYRKETLLAKKIEEVELLRKELSVK